MSQERTGQKWPTSKNYVMRREAANALAAHGPQAASALPALDVAITIAAKAKAATAVLAQKCKAAEAAKELFDLFANPDALAAVKGALEAGAWQQDKPYFQENSAARVLRYLADPKAREFADIPSYSMDAPDPEGVLAEFIEIGQAAATAVQAIRG